MYNDLLQTIFDQGGRPDVTYVNGWQKRKISGFTGGSTRNVAAGSKELIAPVEVYESDFGVQRIVLDRYMTSTVVAALEEDKFKVGFLRNVEQKPLPDAGGGPKGMVEAEYTLESLNEAASGKITGLTTS